MAELNNGGYLHGPHVDPGSDFVKKKLSQFSGSPIQLNFKFHHASIEV